MRKAFYTLAVLAIGLPSAAVAYDDPLYPDSGETLYIDRNTRPNALQQEVDPSYAFHAKAARNRLERTLYYTLLARQEYLLYANHLRTLRLDPPSQIVDEIEASIVALDDLLNPTVRTNPLSSVVTNMPSPSVVVDSDNRSLILSEPTRPYEGLQNLNDGLDSPSARMGMRTTTESSYEEAPMVGGVPTVTIPRPSSTDVESYVPTGGGSLFNNPIIPSYKPKGKDESCSTCGDSGVTINVPR